MSADLASLFIRVDSSGVVTASKDLDALATKSKNVEKATSSMNSNFEKLKTNWLAVSASVVAFTMAMQKAVEYMELGAKALQVQSSFKIMADSSGVAAKAMIDNMAEATRHTIDDSDLMAKAVKLMIMGYDSQQIERFSKNVVAASQIAGIGVNDAFEQMADAIANKMPRSLLKMGAVTKDQMKLVTAAVSEGVDEMALYNLAMANLELRTLQLKGTQDAETIALQQFHKQVSETKEEIGMGLLIVMQKLYSIFQGIGAAGLLATSGIYKVLQGWSVLRSATTTGDLSKAWKASAEYWKTLADGDFKASEALSNKALQNWDGITTVEKKATKEAIDDAQKRVDAVKKEIAMQLGRASAATTNLEVMKAMDKLAVSEMEKNSKHQAELDTLAGKDSVAIRQKSLDDQAAIDKKYHDNAIKEIDQEALVKTLTEKEKFNIADFYRAKLSELNAEDIARTEERRRQEETFNAEKLSMIAQQANENLKLLESMGYAYKDEYERMFVITVNSEADILEVKMKALGIYFDKAKWINEQLTKHAGSEYDKMFVALGQGLGSLGTAFTDISKLYKEGSDGAKQWIEAAKAMKIAQKAVAVVQAVVAIATQGSGDPYTAFARIAAMAAAMGSLLATIGQSVGSSSVSAPVTKPASTVLGAEDGTGSQSIANSLKMLESIYNVEDTKLTKIYNELKDLNSNITGLVTGIVRTGSVNMANMNLPELGTTMGGAESAASDAMRLMARGFWAEGTTFGDNMEKFAKMDIVGTWINQQIVGIVGSIFGGAVETTLVGSGIAIGKTSVEQLMQGMGIGAKQYADILTKKEGGWFSKDEYSLNTIYKDLDSGVSDLFTLVFKNIGSSLLEIAKGLGTDTADVMAYAFENEKINLQGKSTEEMNKALQEYFSNVSDKAVEALFGDMLKGYQKLNEGLMETAVRLITDKETILYYLKQTNQAFTGTIPEAIKFSETLITIAGGLDKLTDALQTYYDAFFNDAEKQSKLKDSMTQMLAQYGFDLPGSRAGYRSLVESLNLTTEAGQTAYVALMQMSKSADQYYKYVEAARANIKPENYATAAEYQSALAGFAEGGISTGPASGYEARLHGTELIVSPRRGYPATINGDSSELVAEVKALRAEMAAGNFAVAKNTGDAAKVLKGFDGVGMPAARGW